MTITILNNGTNTATNVVVDYNYLSGFSFVSGTSLVTYPAPPNDSSNPADNGSRLRWTLTQDIDPGETVTITFDLITNCVAQSGTHSVTVTYDPGGLTTTDTIYITVNHGALVITKTPTVTNAFVGDTVTWTLTIRGTGFGPASNIEITDDLGTGFTFISSTIPGGGLTYTHPSLAAGATLTYTVTARIDSCSDLENTLNVRWGCGGAVYCQDSLSTSASINLTVREPALQFLSVSPSPIVFNFCQEATVTVSLRNNGTGPAVTPHLTPTLPAGYNIINTTAPATWDGTRWTLPTMAAGATVTFSFDLTTSNYCTLNNGLILFDADCTNECGNMFTAPQIEIATMNVLSDFPSLSVTKTAPNEINVGQTINYAVTVSYSGNPTYSDDVSVVDTLPANITPINITGGGVYNAGAGTITWTIPAASVVNGVILNATFDGPTLDTYPELCDYCFNTLTNTITASTSLACPLTPTNFCDISATASASTRVNCQDTAGTATVTGFKEAGFNTTENCTTIPYTLSFTFGSGITDTWSTLTLQEMMNNGQTPSGNAVFTVGAVTVTRPVPADGNWGSLSFLDAAGAPGPANQTLTVAFSLYQPNTGSFYNDAVLTVPSLGGGICGTSNQQVLVTELVNVDSSTGAINVSVPTFLNQCETITVTLNITKGTYPLYNPVVRFISSDYTYVLGSTTWSGDGVNFPSGNIEPSIAGSTLTWNNTQFGLGYYDSGVNAYYAFQNGGTVTFQAVKSSSCSINPDADAELYFDDNCERLGRSGAPSTNLKSSSSDSPIVLSKGNILIRKFPELVTATSDTVSFVVTLVNTGDGISYNTVITDILGDDMLFDPSYTGAASVNPNTVDGVAYNPAITGRTLVFNVGDLDPNDVVQITIPARIVGCDEAEMYNRAEGSWGCGGSPTDCQPLPVSRQVNVNLQDSNLLIRGSGDVYLCEQNTLQLDILNSGRTMDYSVQAIFIIPTGLNYVSGSTLINGAIAGEPTQVGNELIWNFNTYVAGLGDLDPDEMITLTFDVATDCDLSNSVSFQAYGRYIAPCDNYVGNISNTVTYTLEINDNRAVLQVTKLPASQTGELSDSITWTITIRNTGLGTGYHLEFYDALPAGVTLPALPGYGISNQALNGVPQVVFDDGLTVYDLGTAAVPRTLIDIPPSGTITFDITARVDSCSALTNQNQANVRWGCDNGCRFSYLPGTADLTTSPVIALLNHQIASESICGAIFSFDVQNTGSRAVSVNIVDTLPAGLVYAAGTATISSDYAPPRVDLIAEPTGAGTGTITWTTANIPLVYPGETITITFEARNNVAAGNCTMPINGTNDISMTYNNSCGDSFGPVNSSIPVVTNQPIFAIDIQPDTQVVPPATAVCWDVTLTNGVGGDIVDSVDIVITFGPDYNPASITAPNGPDGTVPVIVGNTITYNDITVAENSSWTVNVCGTAITNPDVSLLWVSGTATGQCSSGCFYGTASDTSSSAVGDIVKTVGPLTATIGEVVTYNITVDYDGGSSNYQNVIITDTLPPNISFVSQTSYTGPNAPITPACAAGVCTWNVGNFTSSPTGEQTVIVFTARVDNVAGNQNGNVRTNTARATYLVNGFNYDESDTVDFTIVEPDFNLAKTRNVGTVEGGDTVTWTITATQTAASTSIAYDFVITDTIPSDLTYVAVSQTSIPAATFFSQVGQVLTWTYNSVPLGTSPVVTYQTTVNYTVEPNQFITNPVNLIWTSLSGVSAFERNGSGGVNDYVRNASVQIFIPNPSAAVTKARTTPYNNTIGSTVHYRITADTIRGTMEAYRIRDVLPDFLILNPASVSATPAAWPYVLTITGPNDGTATTSFELNFGTIVNTNPGNTNVVVDFDAIVADVAANDDGEILQNRGSLRFVNFAGTTVTYNSPYVNILIRVPALVTNKTITAVNGGAVTPAVGPGDIITYQYTVQNVGTGPASSVNITDTFPNAYLAYVTGSSRVNAVVVADPTGLPGPNLNFNLSNTINGGATLTLTFDARVLSTVTLGTVITNISQATGRDEINNPIPANNTDHVVGDTDLDDLDDAVITAVIPGLVVDKSVLLINGAPSTGIVQPGDTVRYQVTVQNVGGANALVVDLRDVLPSADFTYVNNSTTLDGVAAANPTIVGNTLTWDLNMTITGGNPVGQTRTIAFDALVGSGIVQGTVYTNTSSAINGTDGNGTAIPTASANPDDTDLDDTDTADLTGAEPALVTDKVVFQVNGGAPTGTPPIVAVSDVVTFRYTVTNVGTGTAYNLDLSDILPSGFTYQAGSTSVTWPTGSYTANPTIVGVNLSWDSSATLAASQVLTLQFNAVVQNSAFIPIPPSGQFENIASATAVDGAGTAVPADNSADVPADTDLDDTDNAFMQPAEPALIVDKSVVSVNGNPLRTFTEPGDTVRYRVTIQNVGGAPALSVDLQDTIDAATTYIAGTTSATWNGAFAGSHTADPSIAGSVLTWDSSAIVGGNGTVLSPSATVTYDFSVHVTSSVTQGGTILNTGHGLGIDGAGVPIPANNSADVPADTDLDDTDSVPLPTYLPGLITDKTVALINGAASTGFIEPGDVVTYQYTIQNVGQAVAYNVDITDTLPSTDFTYVAGTSTLDAAAIADPTIVGVNLSWNTNSTIAGGNPTGATITLRFNVTVGSGIHQGTVYTNTNWAVNGTDGDGGAINTNSGDAQDNDLDDSDAVNLTGREPALVTDKVVSLVNGAVPGSFPPVVAPGDLVTFRYTVTNVGAGTAYNVDLTDILPNGYTYQAGSTNVTWPAGSYTTDPAIAGVNLAWNSTATLTGGQALTLTFVTLVTNNAYRPLPAGNWINTASAFGDDGAGTAIPADNSIDVPADTDLDDTDTADLIPARPALVTDKEVVSVNGVVGVLFVQPGDYIRYRYTITNVGRGIAFNVDTDDTLDIGLSYDIALIPPTTTAASWTGDFAGTHTDGPSIAGAPLTGETLLWDSSAILGTVDGIILTSGAVLTMEYDIYVTTFIIQGTPVDNLAHAAAIDGRGTAVPANSSIAVPADTDLDDTDATMLFTQEPALVVEKSASMTTVRPGDVVTFTITVQNVGLGDAIDLYLTDQLPACFSYVPGTTNVTWPSDPIDPVLSPWNMNPSVSGSTLTFNIGATLNGGNPIGETMTMTFNARVGTGCPSSVTNYVEARGVDGDGNPIILGGIDPDDYDYDDADSVNLNVLVPEISLVKSIALINGATPGTTIQSGDTITYEVVIRNTGLAPLARLVITDIKPSPIFDYVTGSSLYNGTSIADPVISGLQLQYDIIRTLNSGETATLRLSFKVGTVTDGMIYTNCADVVGYDAAGGEINTDESCVDITGYVPPSDGDITKLRCEVTSSGINNKLCAGSIASYCVTFYNNNSLPIVDPHLTFVMPVGIELVPGTFVLDGKVIPDPAIGASPVDILLNTIAPKTTSVICFQMIATSNAKLGRIDFEFVVTDRTGKSTTCTVSNIITVDDCTDTGCGRIEKLNYPIHDCNRLVAVIEPSFDTLNAMYAAGSFYRFAATETLDINLSSPTIESNYNDLWKFRLFDIAEKNLDAVTMRSGLNAYVKLNDKDQLQIIYRSASPYFQTDENGDARYWSSEIDETISSASIGMTLFAQAERTFALRAKTDYLIETTSQEGMIEETENQMRAKVRLLNTLFNQIPSSTVSSTTFIPDTATMKFENGKTTFNVEPSQENVLETSSAILLGLSRYLQWEKFSMPSEPAFVESKASATDSAMKIASTAFTGIRKSIDGMIASLENPGAADQNSSKADASKIDLRALILSSEALREWMHVDKKASEETDAVIRKIAGFIASHQKQDGSFSFSDVTPEFKNQIAAIRILSNCQNSLGTKDYSENIIKGYSFIENSLWLDRFGLYRSGDTGGVFSYTPFDLSVYIQNYLADGIVLKNIGKTALDSRLHRFLDTILNSGGMQLDDSWRQNEHLLVSSFSNIPKTAVFSVPMSKHLMPVLNEKVEFIDPVAQAPESLMELDSQNLIKLESLDCNASYAAPSQRLFVTDIGNFALSELYNASQAFSAYTYPTYLMKKLPNTAWILARKMGEYAIYNSFTLDYSSKSGLDLRFSDTLSTDIASETKAAEENLRKLLSDLAKASGVNSDLRTMESLKPLFVLFGTALPGADKSISEQLIINPKLLGYSEDRRIFLSDVGMNLARQVNEYRFISSNKKDIKYIQPVLKAQISASLEFLSKYFIDGIASKGKLQHFIYPEINSSGKPLNFILSEENTDLFSALAAFEGVSSAIRLGDDKVTIQAKKIAEKLTNYIMEKFYEKTLGRFKNSETDTDLSTVNIYYLIRFGLSPESAINKDQKKKLAADTALLLKNKIIEEGNNAKISVEGKADKISSIVDINTVPAANFAALRTALDIYNLTKNPDWLKIAKQLWQSQLEEGYDSTLKIFKGSKASDQKMQDEVVYRYNSFDIGMIVGAANDIMPYLNENERITAFEGLRVFFDKIVEGAEVQYLPFKEKDKFHTGEFELLPGLRTEVTVKYENTMVLPKGVYPGETVKFILKLENVCSATVSGMSSEYDYIDITDILPPKFEYVKDSTYINGAKGPEPSGDDILYWKLNGYGSEALIVLTFLAKVDDDTVEGDYINYAKMGYLPTEFGTTYVAPSGWAQSLVEILKHSKLNIEFFEDINGNGYKDENEQEHRIPSLTVMLDSTTPTSSTKTGEFIPFLIKPGYHSLNISSINPDTYWWLSGNNPIQFHSRTELDSNLQIALTYRKIIEGFAYEDKNSNGVFDKESEGLVNIEMETSSGKTVISGEKGYFYYISQSPNEILKIKSQQRFNQAENAKIELK